MVDRTSLNLVACIILLVVALNCSQCLAYGYSQLLSPPPALLQSIPSPIFLTPPFKFLTDPEFNLTVAVIVAPIGLCDPSSDVTTFMRPQGWNGSVAALYRAKG
ncbi:unnamed protein product [Sphagnum tenellum]